MAKNLCQQINGKKGSTVRNLLVSGNGTTDGFVAFNPATTMANLASDVRAVGWEGTTLRKWNGTTWSDLSGSSGATTSWDDLYSSDKTLTISGTTLTFSVTHATNNGLTLTSGAGTGHLLQITNSGTGNDINGTSDTWSVTKAGLATFATGSVLGGTTKFGTGSAAGTITSNGAYDLVLETNSGTNSMVMTFVDAANGDIDLVMNGTGKLDMSGTTTHNDALKVGAGDVQVTLGHVDITDDQNAGSLLVTNATATTVGAAAAGGVVAFDSASLTTGILLDLQLTEGTLAGGYYLRAWDVTAGAGVFTVGENGVVVIAGTAVGTAALTLTVGDVVLSDGNVAITSSSTNDVFSITDDSLLANNALIVKGSGTFTGTAASSFVAITPTGASTGTALYVALAAATTASIGVDVTTSTTTGTALRLTTSGVQVDGAATGVLTMVADSATTAGATAGRGLVSLSADALTTGTGIDITSTSLGLAAGELLNVEHIVSGTITAAKTGQLVDITSTRGHTAATAISDDYDALSIIRSGTVNNAGGELNSAGSCLYILNTATQTAGTMADTVNGVEISMQGGAEAQGYGVQITHSGTTVGRAIDIAASQTTSTVMLMTANALTTSGLGLSIASTGTGMTTGSLLRVSSGTTSAVATNGIVSFVGTGAFTSTAATDGLVRINGNSTLSGTVLAVNGNSFTTGVGVYVGDTGTGMTSGSLVRAVSGTTGAVATNGILSVQATGAYTSTANMGILSAIANTTTAGTVAYISATSMVGGTLLFLNATAATLTGKYIQCYDGAADDFSVGQYGATIIAGNAGSTVLTVTAGDLSFADGSLTLADNDNANTVSITNDTATTIGAAANAGLVDISGDGLTTGTALNIGLTEGTLTTGRYLKCWDVTAGAEVFAVEEDGEVFVAEGRATTAGGADAINIGASAAIKVAWGSGAPTYTAPQGSLYLRTDGSSTSTRLYVNTDGAGTWTSCTTAA